MKKFITQDFENFDDLAHHSEDLEQLVNLYQKIFAEPDVWNEHYEREEVINNLKKQLSPETPCRLRIFKTKKNRVIAFFWAQILDAEAIKSSVDSVQYAQGHSKTWFRYSIDNALGNEKVIYIHDLGIDKDYRGKVNLNKLFFPVLAHLFSLNVTEKIFFWSDERTCISHLAHKWGFPKIAELDGMRFFLGDLGTLRQKSLGIRLLTIPALGYVNPYLLRMAVHLSK